MNVLVTGGSRGIGRAIAMRLAETYAQRMFLNYVQNDVEADKTRELVEERDTPCTLVKANVGQPGEIDRLFETLTSSIDELHLFIHCAALGTFKPLSEIRPNQWDLTMNINARSLLLCAQKCMPLMTEGKIIAISSLGGRKVLPDYGAMGPTKSALEAVVRYLAFELAPSGIQVNGVSGGLVKTESLEKFPNSKLLMEEAVRRTPAKRIGTPEDIADVVVFLAGPLSRWICGQVICADGGLSLL